MKHTQTIRLILTVLAVSALLPLAGCSNMLAELAPDDTVGGIAINLGEIEVLTASDGVAGDMFGHSVALSEDGTVAVIGAPYYTPTGIEDGGRVYVYTRSGDQWSAGTVLDTGAGNQDKDGISLAISDDGTTIAVGVLIYNGGWNGAVYVYTSDDNWTTFSRTATLGGITGTDRIGNSVSISADGTRILATGFDGNSCVFDYDATSGSWDTTPTAPLTPSTAADAHYNDVGFLSGDGNTAIIGITRYELISTDPVDTYSGRAFVFATADGTNWTQQASLASDGAAGDSFGYSVTLSDDGSTAMVGAPNHDDGTLENAGRVYVFTRSGTTWTQAAQINGGTQALNTNNGESLGRAVSLGGDNDGIALIVNYDQASLGHIYTGSGASWSLAKTLREDVTAAESQDPLLRNPWPQSGRISGDGGMILIGFTDYNSSQGNAASFTLR